MSLIFKYNGKVYARFNCVLEFNYSQEMTISDNPIEQGSQVADHIVREPSEYTIKAVVGKSEPTSGSEGNTFLNASKSYERTLLNDLNQFGESLIKATDNGLNALTRLKAYFPIVYEFGNSLYRINNATVKSYKSTVKPGEYNIRIYDIVVRDLMFSDLELVSSKRVDERLKYSKKREEPSDASDLYIQRYG